MKRDMERIVVSLAVASAALLGLGGQVWVAAPAAAQTAAPAADLAALRARAPQDEVVYFVLPDRFANGDLGNDRGGLEGGRLQTGFDPAHRGFFHGGDLAGLTARLDYIAGLGATAVWLGPVYENRPVQGAPGQESAGYHGYWITDFTNIDPHFGTREEFRAFVDAAHARGLKVYMDIITNHTADVIQYRGCPYQACAYRARADYPYTRRGRLNGPAINHGFMGDAAAQQTAENFARLTNPDYAYDVFIPRADRNVKTPAWLNDPIYYHNRGNSTWRGESNLFGDFSGLDDLFTEHPRVLAGFIEIFGAWIDDFGVDGFRIDTARHVNPEFWQAFAPAMIARARARGIENFHIFGEAYDPDAGGLARFTRVDRLPSVLDFAFQSAAFETIARNAGTERLARHYLYDALYEGGDSGVLNAPTFLGNHDMGRFAHFILRERPDIGDQELFQRVALGHALMMFARGVPVIYYGDEQGFTGDGGDQDAREDMFPSQVASYNDNRLVGGASSTAEDNFDPDAPLYRTFAEMAAIRAAHPALRRGRQIVRAASEAPGLFAISRVLDGREVLIAFNTSQAPVTANVEVDPASSAFEAVRGACRPRASATGSYAVTVPALDYIVCAAVQG
jgi:glycosidase